MSKLKVLIINGPNLNMLGTREPEVYGRESLEEIKTYTEAKLKNHDTSIEWFQSNSESEIIEKIHQVTDIYDLLVVNPGAFSHTSVAILDALKVLTIPSIEVHLSNTNRRESFRQTKLTAKGVRATIEGLGRDSYHVAIYSQIN